MTDDNEPILKMYASYNGDNCDLTIYLYNIDEKSLESIENKMRNRYDAMLAHYRTMKEIEEKKEGKD